MKAATVLVFVVGCSSPSGSIPDAPPGNDASIDVAIDAASAGFGELSGMCGVLNDPELLGASPLLVQDAMTFARAYVDPADRALLTPGGVHLIETPNAGGSSEMSELFAFEQLARSMPGSREQIVHDYFLFTTIAAVMVGDAIAVWAIGDGVYAIDGRVRELGPFANNQPPYLAYDLVGNPQGAHLEIAHGDSVIVATDGVGEVGVDRFAGVDRFVTHPDALRRHLALLARGEERIDWTARRVVRTPAALQDDGAVAMLVRTSDGGAS